jgi:ActD protein
VSLACAFQDSQRAVQVLRSLHELGYSRLDVCSPYRLEDAEPYLSARPTRLSLRVFAGGVVGAVTAYGLQYWTSVWVYPFEIAGSPLHSWPAFLPFTFEFSVLMASLIAFVSAFRLGGLPRYHHPTFDLPEFDRVSRDRFMILVSDEDPRFRAEEVEEVLKSAGGEGIHAY